MNLSKSIFKAYDIRGVVPDAVNVDMAHALGLAFATKAFRLGETVVAVGRDGRLSSPQLSAALISGLVDAGMEVVDLGVVTTPMLYFATNTLCNSGIQVTGSHNPKNHNGFKLVLAGNAIHGDDIQALYQAIVAGALPTRPGGKVSCVDVQADYIARIVSDVKLARPLKIALDCGNGVAGASAPALFRALGCQVTELFSEVDGNFPNHHPDPSKPENLRDLIRTLQTDDFDLGLAFDGDGDRLGVVTPNGAIVHTDRQMVLFSQDVLSRVPGSAIVFDVKCSQQLPKAIESAGGRAVMYKTGHSLIKAKMKHIGSPLGGEMSGHVFFKERWFGFDDGSYAGARLLEILSRSLDPSAVLESLPTRFSTPELNVPCAEGEPHRVVEQLKALAVFEKGATVITIDGLRVDWADGFGLIRASNTTPVLVLRFEGQTPEALERIRSAMMALLLQAKPDAQLEALAH